MSRQDPVEYVRKMRMSKSYKADIMLQLAWCHKLTLDQIHGLTKIPVKTLKTLPLPILLKAEVIYKKGEDYCLYKCNSEELIKVCKERQQRFK